MDYEQEVALWRTKAEANLRAENGWLAVSGLYWLHEGSNTFGTDDSNDAILPPGSAAPFAGEILLQGEIARVRLGPDTAGVINGTTPVGATPVLLATDETHNPDRLTMAALSMSIIKRGARFGIRLWDNNSEARRSFTGRKWFPVNPAYCVKARFNPYEAPKTLTIITMIGDLEPADSPGTVTFVLEGKTFTLEAESADASKGLFFNFKDATNGHETYGSGRFLTTSGVVDGGVTIDFNKAVSPPCDFTPFATCPLPRMENVLAVRLPVGELVSHH